jgi:hypothetical protein
MSISITLGEGILPEGSTIIAEISTRSTQSDLESLREAITFVHREVAKASGQTSAERLLDERLSAIEKGIVDSLPAETKLALANEIAR